MKPQPLEEFETLYTPEYEKGVACLDWAGKLITIATNTPCSVPIGQSSHKKEAAIKVVEQIDVNLRADVVRRLEEINTNGVFEEDIKYLRTLLTPKPKVETIEE